MRSDTYLGGVAGATAGGLAGSFLGPAGAILGTAGGGYFGARHSYKAKRRYLKELAAKGKE